MNARTDSASRRQKAMLRNRDGSIAWAMRRVACSVPPTDGNGRMCATVRRPEGAETFVTATLPLRSRPDQAHQRMHDPRKTGTVVQKATHRHGQARTVRGRRLDE